MNFRWKTQYKEGKYSLVKTRKLLNKKTKEEKDTDTTQPTKAIIAGNRNNYSLMSININGLNSPMKRHRLSDWIHNQIQPFAAYRKLISETKTDTILE